tara:strand:- start:122 stop:667 length:546 start_codon:yes stop_codon:yes gene_type:complete
MDKFVKTYDHFSEDVCKSLIGIFEASQRKERVENFHMPQFTQVNLNEEEKFGKFVQLCCYKVVEVVKEYKKELPEYTEWFPSKILFEQLRVKKYEPGTEDQFDTHVDIQDHQSAKRYLAFLVYLNDDFTGGTTEFPFHELTIQPKTGRVLVFPPTWQYPHRGVSVTDGEPKYIMSTYLHYS